MEKSVKEAIEYLENFSVKQQTVSAWKTDPYLHGLCNGIILAIAIIAETTPTFLGGGRS